MRIDHLKNTLTFKSILINELIKKQNKTVIKLGRISYANEMNCSEKSYQRILAEQVQQDLITPINKLYTIGKSSILYTVPSYTNLLLSFASELDELKAYIDKSVKGGHGNHKHVFGIGLKDIQNIDSFFKYGGVTNVHYNEYKSNISNEEYTSIEVLYGNIYNNIKVLLEYTGDLYTNRLIGLNYNGDTLNKHRYIYDTNTEFPETNVIENIEKARIGKKLGKLHIKANIFELNNFFCKYYKGYKETKELVRIWNESHDSNSQIYFDLKVKTNKKGYISSISTRAYNKTCVETYNDFEHPDKIVDDKVKRSEYFNKNGFNCISSFDVNSSIPNILAFMRSGTWDNIDWHQKLADKYNLPRNVIKLESMRTLFDCGSIKTLQEHCYNWIQKNGKSLDEYKKHQQSINATYSEYKNGYKSELFLFESMAYIKFQVYAEKEFDCNCRSVYDCFYFDKNVSEDKIISLMKKCFNEIDWRK